jgi:four helix bundle protein
MAERKRGAECQPREIQRRTYAFALRVSKLARTLPCRDVAGWVTARQVARSGTSVGANVAEAHGALSKADFARRIGVARSEAIETLYWLQLITDSDLVSKDRMAGILNEADEIVRVLMTIARKVRQDLEVAANMRKRSKKKPH